jgi:hypothetical protein
MNVRYRIELSQAERCELATMLSKGKRAQILLAADAGSSDEEIVGADITRRRRIAQFGAVGADVVRAANSGRQAVRDLGDGH